MPPGIGYGSRRGFTTNMASSPPPPAQSPFPDFVAGGPSHQDWLTKFANAHVAKVAGSGNQSTKGYFGDLGSTFAAGAAQPAASIPPIGYATLAQILLGQGATDPMLLNRQLADISRTTQGRQDALGGQLAAGNLQGSGVGQALQLALGQAGAEQRGQAIAQETATAEARKRQDLDLLLRLIIDPSLQAGGIALGVPSQKGPSSTDQILSLLATGAGAYLAGCWVAAEVFDGWDDPRTHAARRYILTMAPRRLRELYLEHGQELAERVRRDGRLRDMLRTSFLTFAAVGA